MESGKRATIHDVARQSGVSAATVSKILNGVTTVKQPNVDRVMAAIEDLGYRADPVASELRQGQRRLIAAIVPELNNPFFGALISGIEDAAETAGYKVIFGTSRESEEREIDVIQRMHDWRVSGAILVPVQSERGRGAALLADLGITSVLLDRVSASSAFDTVTADNFRASADVAQYLAEQGHRHILLHCATATSEAVRMRVEGFTSFMRRLDAGIRIDVLLNDINEQDKRGVLGQHWDRYSTLDTPTAVFALSQHSTLVVLSELRRRKITVSGQVALVGFDDADWMQTTWPSITAVAQPVEIMAKQAIAALLTRLANDGKGYPIQHLERCVLNIRESTHSNDAGRIGRRNLDQPRTQIRGE
ncbi:LacI family transcriptional regulator [Paracoccaceae bacterium]|nr:LacI family transcriptional regulator [Paracoccaceae bacterium]